MLMQGAEIVSAASEGLAPKIVGDVLATIRKLREEGVASLIVEQNAEIALSVADHAAIIDRGRIAWTGDAGDYGESLPFEIKAVRKPAAFACLKTSTAHSAVINGSL